MSAAAVEERDVKRMAIRALRRLADDIESGDALVTHWQWSTRTPSIAAIGGARMKVGPTRWITKLGVMTKRANVSIDVDSDGLEYK